MINNKQAASNPAYAELRRFCLNPASLELSNPASSGTTSFSLKSPTRKLSAKLYLVYNFEKGRTNEKKDE